MPAKASKATAVARSKKAKATWSHFNRPPECHNLNTSEELRCLRLRHILLSNSSSGEESCSGGLRTRGNLGLFLSANGAFWRTRGGKTGSGVAHIKTRMFKPDANPKHSVRPWREIAEEMSHESDSKCLNELAEELFFALENAEQTRLRAKEGHS